MRLDHNILPRAMRIGMTDKRQMDLPASDVVLPVPGDQTLCEAQNVVRNHLDEGIECPCCGQFAKLYKRSINSGMAATLVWLVGESIRVHGEWIHVQAIAPRYVVRSNEIGKLVHWGLVQLKPKVKGDPGRTSGMWRPTSKGIRFAQRKSRVSRYVYLYSNVPAYFSAELISLDDALGDKFDYAKLMLGK